MEYDVVSVGNALIDCFLTIQKNNRFTQIDEARHELCFVYGEKIHVESAAFLTGGNACNVSVGLSRLGHTTALFAEIGDDEFSKKIQVILSKEKLDLSHMVQTKDAQASFAVGINVHGERTLFVEHVKREHNFGFDDIRTKWLYVTSLGIAWEHVYQKAAAYVKEKGCRLAFSPGTHQLEAGKERFSDMLQYAHILFVNREEAMLLTENKIAFVNPEYEKEKIVELLRELQKMGPKVVSITDGRKGSYSIDEHGTIRFISIFPNQAIERTGAGDAYASGFLAGYMHGKGVFDCMRWGSMNAASVVEQIGAQPGLLTVDVLIQRLSEHPEFSANVLS